MKNSKFQDKDFVKRLKRFDREAFTTSLPRSMYYSSENLEPRYLLSGVSLTADPNTTASNTVKNNFAGAVQAGVKALTQNLSYLGQQINKDSATSQTPIPFLNQTLNQAMQKGGAKTFGQSLLSDLSSNQISLLGQQSTSNSLATLLQSDLNNGATGPFTVTDKSSGSMVDLTVSQSLNQNYTQMLGLGGAGDSFGIELIQVNPGANSPRPDITVQSTVNLSFDLKIDLEKVDSDLSSTATSTGDAFSFTPGAISETLTVNDDGSNGAYLPDFGVQFGIMGAGEEAVGTNYGINGAYSFKSTLVLNDTIDLSFTKTNGTAASSLTSDQLPSSATDTDHADYIIAAPTSTTENTAQLDLNLNVYDDGNAADTNTNPAYGNIKNSDDYIAGLGGVTGGFDFKAGSFLSASPPIVTPNNVELASFARLTPLDIATFAEQTGYVGDNINNVSALSGTLPLLQTTAAHAYGFDTALNNAFVNLLSQQTSLLLGSSAPYSAFGSTDPTDFADLSGGTSFILEIGGPITSTVSFATISVNLSYDVNRGGGITGLQDALQSAIDSAWATWASTNSVTASDPIKVELAGQAGSTQVLQLVATNSKFSFYASGFTDPTTGSATAPVINLGFNDYSVVALQTADYSKTFNFQTPGVYIQTGTINLSNFEGAKTGQLGDPTVFQVAVTKAATGSTPPPVLVTLPSQIYNGTANFVAAVQAALLQAGLQNGTPTEGIQVESVADANGDGGFSLLFYAGKDIASFTISDPTSNSTSTPSFIGNFGTFTAAGSTTPTAAAAGVSVTSTAPFFTLTVNYGGGSTTPSFYTVYVNGNLTNGLLNSGTANISASDLAASLVTALQVSGALSADTTSGITVSSGTDPANGNASFLQFTATNPGNTTTSIASFTISNFVDLSAVFPLNSQTNSTHLAVSGTNNLAAFSTVQELASLLQNTRYSLADGASSSIIQANTAPSFQSISGSTSTITSDSFNFPIQIVVDQSSALNGTYVLPALTNQSFSLANLYSNAAGEGVSNLTTSETATIDRQDSLRFNFGFDLIKPVDTAEQLTATLPLSFLLAKNTLSNDLILQVILDDGITRSVVVKASDTQTNTSLDSGGLYDIYGKRLVSGSTGAGLIGDIQNALNSAFSSDLGKMPTLTYTQVNGTEPATLAFTSQPGSTTELTVNVPADAISTTSVANVAFDSLGFGGASATGNSTQGNTTITVTTVNGVTTTTTMVTNNNVSLTTETTVATANLTSTTYNSTLTDLSVGRTYPANTSGAVNNINDPHSSTLTEKEGVSTIVAGSPISTSPGDLSSSYVLSNYGIFHITLPNGTQATLALQPADTAQIAGTPNTPQTLIAALNSEIVNNNALLSIPYALEQQLGGIDLSSALKPALIAYLSNADGTPYGTSGPMYVAFMLNPDVYGAPSTGVNPINQSWELRVDNIYQQQNPNGGITDLGLPASTVVDTARAPLGLSSIGLGAANISSLSTLIQGNSALRTASFSVSIDGEAYNQLNVDLSNINSNSTIADLVTDINQAIDLPTQLVPFSFNNAQGVAQMESFPLSDYLQAEVTGGGNQIILRLLDVGLASDVAPVGATIGASAPSVYPVLTNATIVALPGNVLTEATTLGLSSNPLFIGTHGAEGTISDLSFTGIATVAYMTADPSSTGPTFGTGDFGLAQFNIGQGVLNEQIEGTLSLTPKYFVDLLANDFENGTNTSGATLSSVSFLLANDNSYAELVLTDLSFPSNDVTGLGFAAGATITLDYGGTSNATTKMVIGGNGITSLNSLPDYTLVYSGTNGLQDLASISYYSIYNSFFNIGASLDAYMSNDPAFNTKLFFVSQTFANLDSIGADFNAAIASTESNPPATLEAAPQAIATALGLPTSAVMFVIQQVVANGVTSEQLNIQLQWSEAVSRTLNLAVDIGGLAQNNLSPGPGEILDYLLNLNSISGTTNGLSVTFSAISQLNLNLTLTSAVSSEVQVPEVQITNPTGGNFFQTNFFLTGQDLNGILPAGTNSLNLSNGQVALDANSQLAFNDTSYSLPVYTYSSTSAIVGYNPSTLTAVAPGAFDISGFAASADSGPFENLISVAGLPGVTGNQTYYLANAGDTSTNWVLDSYTPSTPTATPLAIANSSLTGVATYNAANGGSWTSSGTGALSIQGNLIKTTNPQGLSVIEIQNQSDASEDGIFYVSQAGSAETTVNNITEAATSWVLMRFIPSLYDYAATAKFNPASIAVNYIENAPLLGTYNQSSGKLSGTGNLVIDGVTITTSGTTILLNGQNSQSNSTTNAPNGLYTISFQSGGWTLTLSSTPTAGQRYFVSATQQYYGFLTSQKYAELIEPASYSYQIGNPGSNTDTTLTLPYTVNVATTGALPTGAIFISGQVGANGFEPATLKAATPTAGQTYQSLDTIVTTVTDSDYNLSGTISQQGIDGLAVNVGTLILVKDQANAYENGVYVVTSLGDQTTPWVLTRASFAETATELATIRVNVLEGAYNAGSLYVQTQSLNNIDSSGDSITFSANLSKIYSNSDTTTWFTFGAVGGGDTFLPLGVNLQTTIETSAGGTTTTGGGNTTLINRDLISNNTELPQAQLQAFANEGAQINSDPTYLQYALFQPLQLSIPSLYNYNYDQGQPHASPGSVKVVSLPELKDSFIDTSILDEFKDGFFVGDALDLTLLTLQSAIDEAVSQDFPLVGTALAEYAGFVELFRDAFTTNVRQNLLTNPLEPLNDIRNALYQVIGPAGLNLLVPLGDGPNIPLGQSGPGTGAISEDNIVVLALDSNGNAVGTFNLDDHSATSTTYGITPTGQEYEKVASDVASIAFGFTLAQNYSPRDDGTLDTVDLGNNTLGFSITNSTEASTNYGTEQVNSNTTGGVLIERKDILNFGFGMTLPNGSGNNGGFFAFNPLANISASNPFYSQIVDKTAQPIFDFGFKAMLTGDINNSYAVPFVQTQYASKLNQLNIQIADARLLDYVSAGGTFDSSGNPNKMSAGDGLPSGFYGDFLFNFSSHTLDYGEAINNNLAFTGTSGNPDAYSTLTDLRLGVELTSQGSAIDSVFNFALNADSDIDLIFQSQKQGLIPSIEADFIYDKSWGSGAASTFGLIFTSSDLLGLGNISLGAQEYSSYNADLASGTAFTADNFFVDNGNSVSPLWRFDRGLLTVGGDGHTFAAYQNLGIDAVDYLSDTFLNTIKALDTVIAPFEPFLTFLSTPIPGTSVFVDGGLVLASILGQKFANFVAVLETIDNTLLSLQSLAQEESSSSGNDVFIAPIGVSQTTEFGPNMNYVGKESEVQTVFTQYSQPSVASGSNSAYNTSFVLNSAPKTMPPVEQPPISDKAKEDRFAQLLSTAPKFDPDDDTLEAVRLLFADDPAVTNMPVTKQEEANSLSDALNSATTGSADSPSTGDKISDTFKKLGNGDYFTQSDEYNSAKADSNYFSQKLNEIMHPLDAITDQINSSGGATSNYTGSAAISTGAILLDALDASNVLLVLEGQTANLLRIDLPAVTATFTYSKSIPLPAFPPLQLVLGFTIGISFNINVGWDTAGSFANERSLTPDANGNYDAVSPFGFFVSVDVGVALNFAIVIAQVTITFTVNVSFFWQDIAGTGKLHASDFSYLSSHQESPLYAEITGTLTLEFSVNFVIPIPLIGPITIPILDLKLTVTIFDVTIGQLAPQAIILGSVSDGVLTVNSGLYAANRIFINTSNDNELFNFYSLAVDAAAGTENILVEFDNAYFEEFDNIKTVVAYAGNGTESFNADPTPITVAQIISQIAPMVSYPTVQASFGASSFTSTGSFYSGDSVSGPGSNTTSTSVNIVVWDANNSGTTKTYATTDPTTTFSGLTSANVLFYGGDADVNLVSGISTSNLTSVLVGGSRTSYLDASNSSSSVDLIGGVGPSTLLGSTKGGDILASGQSTGFLFGNGENDLFYIQGGFLNDRIYVIGTGNSVSFAGATVTPSYGSAITIAPVTSNITFQFGSLVESAKSGLSTVFFATDPSTDNQIDSWTGGLGQNTYNVFDFLPNQTLTITSPPLSGTNTYNVYLGDPQANVSPDGSTGTENKGTINIVDTPDHGILNLTQTDPTPINNTDGAEYNGRETLTYSGIVEKNINAGNSPLTLGTVGANGFAEVTPGNITASTIILVSNVEIDTGGNNITFKLSQTLELNYDLDFGDATAGTTVTIDLLSPLTDVAANLILTNGAILSISSNSTQDRKGSGTIYLNLPTGGIFEMGSSPGAIEVGAGLIAITSRDGIGASNGNDIEIETKYLAANTAGGQQSSSSTGAGIFIYSLADLILGAFDAPTGLIVGLSTTVGDIEVDMSPGTTLTFLQIVAGSSQGVGGNVTLNSDYLQASSGFDLNITGYFAVPLTLMLPYDVLVQESVAEIFNLSPDSPFYPSLSRSFFDVEVTRYIEENVTLLEYGTRMVAFGGQGSDYPNLISGSGTLTLENVTTPWNIVVGDTKGATPPANTLILDSAILGDIQTTFSALVIGRPDPAGLQSGVTVPYVSLDAGYTSPFTGKIAVYNNIVFDIPKVILQAATLNLLASVINEYEISSKTAAATLTLPIPSSDLELTAYDASAYSPKTDLTPLGTITFDAGSTYEATSLYISAAASLDLSATFLSGSYLANAGTFMNGTVHATSTAGSIDLSGMINVNTQGMDSTGATVQLAAAKSISLESASQIISDQFISLVATNGTIEQKVSNLQGTPTRLRSGRIYASAGSTLSLYTDTVEFTDLVSGSSTITIDNSDGYTGTHGAVQIDNLNSDGDVNFTNSSGAIFVGSQQSINATAPTLISAVITSRGAINLISGSSITDTNFAYSITTLGFTPFDIQAEGLTVTASGAVNLVTDVANLNATVLTNNSTFTLLNQRTLAAAIITKNGVITLVGENSLTLDNLDSGGADIAVSTEAYTMNPDSNITVGTVDAGAGFVSLSAGGTIMPEGGSSAVPQGLINASVIQLETNPIQMGRGDIEVTVQSNMQGSPLDLSASTFGSGNIDITAESATYLRDISTQAGTIKVTSDVNDGARGVDDFTVDSVSAGMGANDADLETSGSITDNPTGAAGPLITADNLTLIAGLGLDLTVNVTSAVAQVTGMGDLVLRSNSSINLEQAVTQNGIIQVTAGLRGASGDYLTAGAIYVGEVTAGGGMGQYDDVTLSAADSFVSDITNSSDPNPSIFYQNYLTSDLALVTAATLNLDTLSGVPMLHTAVATLNATSDQTGGSMTINQVGDILVNVVTLSNGGDFNLTTMVGSTSQGLGSITVNTINGANSSATGNVSKINLTSLDGFITQAVDGNNDPTGLITGYSLNALSYSGPVQLLTNVGELSVVITGLGGAISVTQSNSTVLGQIYTPEGNFTLNLLAGGISSDSSVIPSSNSPDPVSYIPAEYHITANDITISSPDGMGSADQYINIYADQLDATVQVSGGIFFHNYKTHPGASFNADDLATPDGPVNLISAGNLYIQKITDQASTPANNIGVSTTDGGDILLNFIGTGLAQAVIGKVAPPYGNVTISSDGDILAVDQTTSMHQPLYSNPVVNIVAHGVNLHSQTGIGSAGGTDPQNPSITGALLSASAVRGNIIAGNVSAADFFIDGFTTGYGDLGFIQSGGGALSATNFSTAFGSIALRVEDAATLYLGDLSAIGDISLKADHIEFNGGPASIYGTATLNISPNSPNQHVRISSPYSGTSLELPNTLEIGFNSFRAFFTDFKAIYVGNSSNAALTYIYYFDAPYANPQDDYFFQTTITQSTASTQGQSLLRLFDYFEHSEVSDTLDFHNLLETPLDSVFNLDPEDAAPNDFTYSGNLELKSMITYLHATDPDLTHKVTPETAVWDHFATEHALAHGCAAATENEHWVDTSVAVLTAGQTLSRTPWWKRARPALGRAQK